ncbi:MAG TPA: hypothetical protein VGB85_14500, partial [Nannocystis sp.]
MANRSERETWTMRIGGLALTLVTGCFYSPTGSTPQDASTSSGGGDEATATTDTTEVTPTTSQGETQYCADKDGDGFGEPDECITVPSGQTPPPGIVANPDDCDDTSANTFPGAAPNDDTIACMKDEDGDDWGDVNPPVNIVPGTDCDDANMNAWAACGTCADADGDGWFSGCDAYPEGFPSEDCDDGDAKTFAGAAPNDDPQACMTDADDDDWGDNTPTDPEAVPGTDCDDASNSTFPGAAMLDDATACMKDADDDGHG